MAKIMVVDDEAVMRSFLVKALVKQGHEVDQAEGAEQALERFAPRRFDLVVSDLKMPGRSGLELLDELRQLEPDLSVVVMSAFGSISTAVEAMRRGAEDFLTKPLELGHLAVVVDRVLARRATRAEVERLRPLADERERLGDMIGRSRAMRSVYALLDKVAPSDMTVLILGETGVGKELCARAIHELSARQDQRLQVVNCAGFQETLLESELFGHEKGAFTGADQRRIGHFEAAAGGTLFLDEIAESSLPVQAKLLRAIQEKEITRVGGTDVIPVDVRIVSATNKDLEGEVAAGRFREDLYYRLASFPVELPPLRQRLDDLPLLLEAFLQDQGGLERCAPDLLLTLSRFAWPGNVRQLKSAVERAAILAGAEPIAPEHFRELKDLTQPEDDDEEQGASPGQGLFELPLREARQSFERLYLEQLLRTCQGNVSEAARRAGLGRPSLHDKLNKLGVDPSRFRE